MVKIYMDSTVRDLRNLHQKTLNSGYDGSSIPERLAWQAEAILDGHKEGNAAVTFHLGSWCPGMVGDAPEQIMAASLSLVQARETIAREHGYVDWSEVEGLQNVMLDGEFEKAVDAVVEGNIVALKATLDARPELATQQSQYGHRATLLHYIGANGVESYRQITPINAPDIASCLLQAGADVNVCANMYGGSTALNLVLTSAHPHNAGIATAIAEVLRSAGAK